jgi:hypothetical protein
LDEQGLVAEGQEVYVDIQGDQQTIKMRDFLPSPARFLHPEYLREDGGESKENWESWLRSGLGVNVYPRLVRGRLSPEFEALVGTVDTRQLLIILKETWPHWRENISTAGISSLSEMVVSCEDGKKHSLRTTYLRRGQLTKYSDLPLLPVDDPTNPDWDFVRRFNVTVQVDGTFFLGRLIHLKDVQSLDEGVISDTYKQLEARFDDDPRGIR